MEVSLSSKTLLVLLLTLAAVTAFAGPAVVRVQARNYQELYSHVPFKGTSINIAGAVPGESYDLVVDRAELPIVLGCGLPAEVIIDDLDTRRGEAAQDGSYHSYDQLITMMRGWAATYPSICQLESLGPTYENHWLYGVKIASAQAAGKPECLELGIVHAREWAGVEAARHLADTLIRFYATNPDFQSFIDNHQLHVVMVTNVDGYMYDYPSRRMWRKDRQPFSSSIGCDPNRDFNGACIGSRFDDWGALAAGTRSTHLPSDETFMGGRGAWALEIKAVSDWFKQHTFVACISVHTYSELVLWPFGTGTLTPDNSYFISLGQRIASRMGRISGGTYTPEQSNYLYPTNDGSDDWFYGWAHTIGGFPCMSFTTELGTSFYQSTSQLDTIQNAAFRGHYYLFKQSDSIIAALEGMVPRPIPAAMDSSSSGSFIVHWTPIRPEHNHPTKWELEELSGLTTVEDGFESGTGKWTLQGASQSTTQKHAGSYSVSLGTGNNISNYLMTTDPYPVQAGDSVKYWLWYNTESNYDVVVTEVSLEGKEWFQLHDRLTGNSSGWVRQAYSLAPWVGKSVYVRVRYMTDDNTLGTGVYVDDFWPTPAFANKTVVSNNITDTLYQVTGKTPGRYYYRVRGFNAAWSWGDKGPVEDIAVTGSGVEERPQTPVTRLELGPNPAAGNVNIRFGLALAGQARVELFDATGRVVRTLGSAADAGAHSLVWDRTDDSGRKVQAGVYYVRLSADRTLTARLVLVD